MADFGKLGIQQREPEPARIKSVTIEGFRSLRSIQNLELPQLAVLIGANGAGKSTLIRFFEMLSWMLKSKSLQEFVLRHNNTGESDILRGVELLQIGGQAYWLTAQALEPDEGYQALAAYVQLADAQELVLVGLPGL